MKSPIRFAVPETLDRSDSRTWRLSFPVHQAPLKRASSPRGRTCSRLSRLATAVASERSARHAAPPLGTLRRPNELPLLGTRAHAQTQLAAERASPVGMATSGWCGLVWAGYTPGSRERCPAPFDSDVPGTPGAALPVARRVREAPPLARLSPQTSLRSYGAARQLGEALMQGHRAHALRLLLCFAHHSAARASAQLDPGAPQPLRELETELARALHLGSRSVANAGARHRSHALEKQLPPRPPQVSSASNEASQRALSMT